MELYKARLREELRVEAEVNAEKKFEVKRKSIENRERLVELKEHGLQLKTDAVNAAVKKLSVDKTQFDKQKSDIIKGVEAKYEKILEERNLMFHQKVEEVRNSLNSQMVEAEVSVLESFKRRVASVGCPEKEQERAIDEL